MLRDNVVFFSNVQKPCVFVQIKIPRQFLHEFILLCLLNYISCGSLRRVKKLNDVVSVFIK